MFLGKRKGFCRVKRFFFLGTVLFFFVSGLNAQSQTDDNSAPLTPRERELLKRVDELERRLATVEAQQRDASTQPTVPTQIPAAVPTIPPAATVNSAAAVVSTEKANPAKPVKAEPFAFADWSWLNGNPRTIKPAFDSPFFTPEIRADVDYVYDFNHPKDDTLPLSVGGIRRLSLQRSARSQR